MYTMKDINKELISKAFLPNLSASDEMGMPIIAPTKRYVLKLKIVLSLAHYN
jgi:hypothetical protein